MKTRGMFKSQPTENGFTLVEVIVVILIVSILSATAIASLVDQSKKANLTEAQIAISAALKNGMMLNSSNNLPANVNCSDLEIQENSFRNWIFTCSKPQQNTLSITAQGSGYNPSIDQSISSGEWSINLETGIIKKGEPVGI